MNHKDQTDIIEAYLDDALPDEVRRDFECRLETDESLRKEVQLHRFLREKLSEPARWKHYAALAGMKNAPLPDEPAIKKKPFRIWPILLAAVLLGTAVWVWQRQRALPPPAIEPVEQSVPTVPSPDSQEEVPSQPEPPLPQPQTPDVPAPLNHTTAPVAQYDPADFAANDQLEQYLSGLRTVKVNLTVESPPLNFNFNPGAKGKTEIVFKGTAEGVPAGASFAVLLFNNRDHLNPIESFPLPTSSVDVGTKAFNLRQALSLPPGLYYFIIEMLPNGEEVYGGKFTVGGR